jgi:PTS system cellobiose-specific IIC component
VAIVISLLSTEIYRFVASRNLVIRMPDGVPPAVAKSFLALIPGFCVLAVVLALRLAVEASPFGDINSMIATHYRYSDAPRRRYAAGDDYLGYPDWYPVDAGPARRCYRAGVYPAGVAVEYVRKPDGVSERADSAYHYAAVLRPVDCPGRYRSAAWAGDFYAVRSRSQQMKQLGKIAAPGALFNISEPMVFGIPLVMNPGSSCRLF